MSRRRESLGFDKDLENLVPVLIMRPRRAPTEVPVETVRPASRIRRASKEQSSVTQFRQFLASPIQKFSADSKILKLREYCEDLYLSGFTHAEAEPDYGFIDHAYVTRQRPTANVYCPGFRCNAHGA